MNLRNTYRDWEEAVRTIVTQLLAFETANTTALDLKANKASPTFTGTVTLPTPFTLGAVSVLPTGTELNFVDGVTSAIQGQIDGKAALAGSASQSFSMLNAAYSGTLTGGTGIVNIGTGQIYKDAAGSVGIGTASPAALLHAYASGSVISLVGDDTNTTTNANKGWRVVAYSDGDVYQDTKTYSSGSLHLRIGQGTETGATREWMTVTGATGAAILGSTIRLKSYTVATLPTGTQGDKAFVTDALAPAYRVTVAGGGAVVTEVFYDGTNWVCT